MEPLTPRQQRVLSYITVCLETRGYPPTLREIAGHLGINGTLGVMKHLEALDRKGFIHREPGDSRGITLARPKVAAVSLPIVGVVRAGLPQPAREEIEGYFAIDRDHVRSGGAFFLRVRGDSMVNAAILEGDLALIRPQATAENRDIVVAMVDGEATLKRFYREKGHIRLQPENPNLSAIIVREGEGEVNIIGKVIGIFRPLE
ncbi:transcriptional repressor LexA [Geomobilimonas luticola]|uniref:LexA repressor n=1 Tax=Geomobilimonas luticola TaxID=1114878 RepID=A0ABS5SGP6_9BACT|nr:transcriptional repressor LexA [Geomobilimonas luticola]MBT0654534.1 transcriptional repressor LexA [Geomobilimonas luticola]